MKSHERTESPIPGNFVQVGATQTLFPGDAEVARAQYERFYAISLDNILEPRFLEMVMRVAGSTPFGPGHTQFGAEKTPGFREVELSPQRVGRLLNLALNRPVFLRWLEDVTGCDPLGSLSGRLTQTLNRPGDELHWHDDFLEIEGRRLAIVINLGTAEYEGGEFALRHKGGEIILEQHYTRPGEALIFKVDRSLEHRVLPLTSGGPRRVFAGWAFRA